MGIGIIAGKPVAVIAVGIVQAFGVHGMGLRHASAIGGHRNLERSSHFGIAGGAAQLAFQPAAHLAPFALAPHRRPHQRGALAQLIDHRAAHPHAGIGGKGGVAAIFETARRLDQRDHADLHQILHIDGR